MYPKTLFLPNLITLRKHDIFGILIINSNFYQKTEQKLRKEVSFEDLIEKAKNN